MVELIKFYPAIFKTNHSYSIYIANIDGCISYGETFEDGIKNIREALTLHLSGMFEDGETVPNFNLEHIKDNLSSNEVLVMVEPNKTLLLQLIKRGKAKRINITLDEYLLEFTDLRARELKSSRSALIESGLKAILY